MSDKITAAGGYVCGGCGQTIPPLMGHSCGSTTALYSVDAKYFRNPHTITPTGWHCPSCGTVWAPHVQRCNECSPMKVSE